jgi:HlyD family secretion protein
MKILRWFFGSAKAYVLPLIAGLMLLFAGYHIVNSQTPQPKASPPVSPARSPFDHQVAGLGLVEPRAENVSIGSPIAGVVVKIFVKDGEKVRAGQPLFQLDTREAAADVRVHQAMLDASQAQLERLEQMPRKEELPPVTAQIDEAKANLRQKEDAMRRSKRLVDSGAVPDEEYVRNTLAVEGARANLAKLDAQDLLLRAGAWSADKLVARAAVEQARSQFEQAKTELERHVVTAPEMADDSGEPIEWEVLKVSVRPGEFVGAPASEELIVLGDTGKRNVRVDIDENDIPRFQPAATAIAYARGSTERKYNLRFLRVQPFVVPKRSLSGDNTERVDTRVLQVIYAMEQDDRSVYVGQQMDVFIQVGDVKEVAQR